MHVVVVAVGSRGLPTFQLLLALIFVVVLDDVEISPVDLIRLGSVAFDRVRALRLACPQPFLAISRDNRDSIVSPRSHSHTKRRSATSIVARIDHVGVVEAVLKCVIQRSLPVVTEMRD